MFATLPSRSRAAVTAFALLLPILGLISAGPSLIDGVDRLTAETLYTAGLSSLLVLLGAAGLLALPRTDAEIGAAAVAVQQLARASTGALPGRAGAVVGRPASA